jgi:hypothetical protein
MTDYTTIPDETFNAGNPVLGSTILAMHKNLAAMCEGAANAPRINLSEALIAPVAGEGHTILNLRDQEIYNSSDYFKESRGPCAAFVLRGGSIRISCQIKANTYYSGRLFIFKNNTLVFEDQTLSTSYVDKIYDFSVSPGDILSVYASHYLRYLKILSSTPAYGAVI